jgi:hypothetical protein
MAGYLNLFGGSATGVVERGVKQRATIVWVLIAAAVAVLVAVTVFAMVTESRQTAEEHVRNFEQSPTYP